MTTMAGVRFPAEKRFFSSPRRPDRLWAHPIYTGGSFLGVKRPGREYDHSRPSSAQIHSTCLHDSA
jgi:hypothetical protein